MSTIDRDAPPRTQLQDVGSQGQGVSREAKPLVIWLQLALACLFGLLFGAATLLHLTRVVSGGARLGSVLDACVFATVTLSFVALALAVHRRRPRVARLLGTVLFVLGAAAVMVAGAPDPVCRLSAACTQGWWLGRFAVAFALVAVAWLAAWSRAARRYYAVTPACPSGA